MGLKIIFVILMGFTAEIAFAHPVSYKGAIAFTSWNQPFMSDQWIAYSLRSDTAIAGRYTRMDMKDGELNYSGLQVNYLLKRWNGHDLQANIYVYSGGGNANFDQKNGAAFSGGFEADIENRKYFSMIKAETMNPRYGQTFNHIEARLGVAPYEAEYTEIASWLMLQGQWHPKLAKQFVITPLARFFYKSFLFETGVSMSGDWMINFMFHF